MPINEIHRLPRRDFLALGGGALATSVLLNGCSLLDEDGNPTETPGAQKGPEAPNLAEKVEAGELPPVEERLPSTPLTVEPVDRIGIYGGTWRTAFIRQAIPTAWAEFTIGGEYLVRFEHNTTDLTANGVSANVAESFDYNDAGTEFTFTLREGMRWSDGEPFTADDILFWYEAIFLNDELSPAKTTWLTSAGEPVHVEKIDNRTVQFNFAEPNGLFLPLLARQGDMITRAPKHYLSQFHPDHADDIDAQIEAEGVNNWVELFEAKGATFGTRYTNPEMPTLEAWTLEHGVNADVEEIIARRNPYYWKVDPDGSQLPYIDSVHYAMFAEADTLLINAMNGDIDYHFPQLDNGTSKPLFADNREQGDYSFFSTTRAQSANPVIQLNLAHQDPVKREVFQNKDFRIGLSYAINRQEIIDAVFSRQGEPYQAAPRPTSDLFDDEMAHQYTEFDPSLANEHLDRAGYSETNAEGIRLGPDGNPISFQVEVVTSSSEASDTMQMVKSTWREVGIDIEIKAEDQSLFNERLAGYENDAVVWFGTGGLNALLDPGMYFPFGVNSRWAYAWKDWYVSRGEQGEEPPEAPKRQMELYDRLQQTADPDEQTELLTEIIQIAKEEFYTIGVSLWADGFGIVKNDFHNTPDNLVIGAYPSPAVANPSQFFRQ